MYKLSLLDKISVVLVLIGAINWGIIGLFNYDVIAAIFQNGSLISRIIYTLVGLCGIIVIITIFKMKKSTK